MSEDRTVAAVFFAYGAGGNSIVQGPSQQTRTVRLLRIVRELPAVNSSNWNIRRVNPLAGHNTANHSRVASPAAGAILHVTMKALSAAIDACDKCVRSPPFVHRLRIKVTEKKVAWPRWHKDLARGRARILQGQSLRQPKAVISSLASGMDGRS